MKKYQTKLYIVFILGTLLFIPMNAMAAGDADITSLEKSVNELLTAKDSTDSALSPEEELGHRKNIVISAAKLALDEIDSFRKKLNEIQPADNSYKNQKAAFINSLNELTAHYNGVIKSANDIEDIDKIKNLATVEKKYRENEYIAGTNKAIQFILVFQTESLVRSAEIRYDKIGSDLKTLEKANLITTSSFSKEMSDSKESIINARSWIEKAKTSILPAKEENIQIMTVDNKVAAPTTEELRTASIVNLKSAYDNFLKISTSVKKTLGR